MEGAKTAMYAQAGRSHTWSKVQPAAPERPAAVFEPPVVELPVAEMPVVELPVFESAVAGAMFFGKPDMVMPQEKCQEIAMVFAQMQKWQELYEADHGFSRGTIFAELDLPWMGKGGCKDE